jgi:hypothetical protein
MRISEGDTIEVLSNKVEQPNRRGVVQRTEDDGDGTVRLEVAWDDGHTSVFVPAAGNVVVTSTGG